MSTAERYGTAIWEACLEVQLDTTFNGRTHFSARQVGEVAGVSVKTARKYMHELAARGYLVKFVSPDSCTYYEVRPQFRKGVGSE